jgi:hypothetical protein
VDNDLFDRSCEAQRIYCVALIAVFLSVGWSRPVGAQAPDQTAITGFVGVGVRGAGNVGDCCGPYRSEVQRSTTLWLGGSVSKNVASRVNLDGELTWAREPDYVAYMQGVLGEAPVRGYRADNQIQALTMAGLVRLRSWYSAKAAIDLVAGLGWAREERKSHLESIVFRPGPMPLPTLVMDTQDARHLMPLITGVDFIATGADSTSSWVRTILCARTWNWGGRCFASVSQLDAGSDLVVSERRGHVDRGELARAMEPGQGVSVATIRLDPIATPFRNVRRTDDRAGLPCVVRCR